MTEQDERAGPAQRPVELGVAIAIAVFALIVIAGSLQVGIGWGPEGPKSGFFPFYLGVLIIGASLSGIGTACQVRPEFPTKSIAVLERRERPDRTWGRGSPTGAGAPRASGPPENVMVGVVRALRPWKWVKAMGQAVDGRVLQ